MALNFTTNANMTGRHTAADANYPYGSSKDESSPGAGDGSPYFEARANDIVGFQQALLESASIVPNGNADTAILSEYMEALVEIASGRAINYDESGAANAYILDVKTNQQGPRDFFDGLTVVFYPTNSNTGASTVNVHGLGVKNITDTASGGELPANTRIELVYNDTSGEFEITASAAEPVVAGFIYGLKLSNAADTDHDIFFDVGKCADSTNLFNLELTAALTKQIDAAWLAGDNVGGLFTGVVANNTNYHLFLIQKDSDGSIDCGFDISVTAANIPAGYTAFRRLGYLKTDGSANIDTLVSIDESSKVVQVVNIQYEAKATGTTLLPNDDTIPQSTEGDEYMQLPIIPTDSSNFLLIIIEFFGMGQQTGNSAVALFQDAIADALTATAIYTNSGNSSKHTLRHHMAAGSTSELIFKVRGGQEAAGTFVFNGSGAIRRYGPIQKSSITIMEIKS